MPTLRIMEALASTLFALDRGYVRVAGPEAADFLERMLSNDVLSLEPGRLATRAAAHAEEPDRSRRCASCAAGDADFLLLTEPELGEARRVDTPTRSRFAAKCEIALEEHHGLAVVFGAGEGIPNGDDGVEAVRGARATTTGRGRRPE